MSELYRIQIMKHYGLETAMNRETWSIPPQPGPKVTHVRDAMVSEHTGKGRLWERRTNGKWSRNDRSYGVSWYTLLGLGPLTDATGDDDE